MVIREVNGKKHAETNRERTFWVVYSRNFSNKIEVGGAVDYCVTHTTEGDRDEILV